MLRIRGGGRPPTWCLGCRFWRRWSCSAWCRSTAPNGLSAPYGLQRRAAQYETEVTQWQTRAEQALLIGDETYARQALARKLQVQHVAGHYADAQIAQQRSLDQVQAAVAHMDARIRTVQVGRGSATLLAARDHRSVEAHFEQFELDQAMDALWRTVQRACGG